MAVTIIAENENEKSHLPITFAFFLPSSFSFSLQIFLKIAPPTQFFGYFIFSLQKNWMGLGGVENYVYTSEILCNNIWFFLCVLVGVFWCFFECFYCFWPCLKWFFAKIFKTSIFTAKENRWVAIASNLPSSKSNKSMETFWTKWT